MFVKVRFDCCHLIFITRSEVRKVPFLAPLVCILDCMWNISGIAEWICAKLHGRRVWSLAQTNLKVKVKVALGCRNKKRHYRALSAACVRFMFGKTCLASSFNIYLYCVLHFELLFHNLMLLFIFATFKFCVYVWYTLLAYLLFLLFIRLCARLRRSHRRRGRQEQRLWKERKMAATVHGEPAQGRHATRRGCHYTGVHLSARVYHGRPACHGKYYV